MKCRSVWKSYLLLYIFTQLPKYKKSTRKTHYRGANSGNGTQVTWEGQIGIMAKQTESEIEPGKKKKRQTEVGKEDQIKEGKRKIWGGQSR